MRYCVVIYLSYQCTSSCVISRHRRFQGIDSENVLQIFYDELVVHFEVGLHLLFVKMLDDFDVLSTTVVHI
jgi:hypothetical protein